MIPQYVYTIEVNGRGVYVGHNYDIVLKHFQEYCKKYHLVKLLANGRVQMFIRT